MENRNDLPLPESLAGASQRLAPASPIDGDLVGLGLPTPYDEDAWRDESDGPVPTRGVGLRSRVPDLTRIHPDAWRAVLAPLTERDRGLAAHNPLLGGMIGGAVELADSLPPPASAAAWAAVEAGAAVPVPSYRSAGRVGRQVNFRLGDDDHGDLQRAAHVLGTRPGQLARMLVLNGVRRVLAEHDAAIDQAREAGARAR